MAFRKTSQKRNRSIQFEPLESRELMASDAFSSFGSLTFSFAPDGTPVGQRINELKSGLDAVAPTKEWQAAIATALQKWVSSANINIGMVSDDGSAAGVYGPTRGDPRFGDIRVLGFGLNTDTFAEAVDEDSRSVGSWAGDVVFNTDAAWKSVLDIESAAIHEAGHILGLQHSTDPLSPMHTHGASGALVPTAADIAALRAIHGPRIADPHEGSGGNDSIGKAAPIKGSAEDTTVASGFNGSQVWVQFGDLLTSTDRDVYEIRTALGYTGPLAVEVRTQGYSLARLQAQITDRNGNVLASSAVTGDFGGVGLLQLPQTISEGKYYLHVFSGSDPFWSQGDYGITIADPTRLANEGAAIVDWSLDAHRWYYDSDFSKTGFSYQLASTLGGHPVLDDDHHADDAGGNKANVMTAVLATNSRTTYRAVGTISDLTDVDQYRVQSPKTFNGPMEMAVDIESLELNGLVPEADVLDASGKVLSTETRVRGYGQFQIVLPNPALDTRYVVRLRGLADQASNRVGNFSLFVNFTAPSTKPDLVASGTLSQAKPESSSELYVARPQLFSFGLEGMSAQGSLDGQIWLSVFDENLRRVSGFVAPIGSFRSSPGLLLDPGTYYLQIGAAVASGDLPPITFHLTADRPSQPIGPVIGTTGVQPKFLCPGETARFCYPNSTIPTSTPTGTSPTANPPSPLPPVSPLPAPPPPDRFFWQNLFLTTNPTLAVDVNNDGLVTPLDALIIINYLNLNGSGPYPALPNYVGFLDTTADGKITPLDALLVINYLNARS